MAEENRSVQAPALDESEQYQIRKDKLAALCEAGRDPYTITK